MSALVNGSSVRSSRRFLVRRLSLSTAYVCGGLIQCVCVCVCVCVWYLIREDISSSTNGHYVSVVIEYSECDWTVVFSCREHMCFNR